MKAQTICVIKDILEQKVKDATKNYTNNEVILKQKYGDSYYTYLTYFEKVTYNRLTKEMNDCYDLLDDFNEHNWD